MCEKKSCERCAHQKICAIKASQTALEEKDLEVEDCYHFLEDGSEEKSCERCAHQRVCVINVLPEAFEGTDLEQNCRHFLKHDNVIENFGRCGKSVEGWRRRVGQFILAGVQNGASTNTIALHIVDDILEDAIEAVKEDLIESEKGGE